MSTIFCIHNLENYRSTVVFEQMTDKAVMPVLLTFPLILKFNKATKNVRRIRDASFTYVPVKIEKKRCQDASFN